jgi:hypothetical protein
MNQKKPIRIKKNQRGLKETGENQKKPTRTNKNQE